MKNISESLLHNDTHANPCSAAPVDIFQSFPIILDDARIEGRTQSALRADRGTSHRRPWPGTYFQTSTVAITLHQTLPGALGNH